MKDKGFKQLMVEGWVFVVIAVIAFVGGLLIGDLGSSPKTETVAVVASGEGEGAEGAEGAEEEGAAEEAGEGEEGGEASATEPGRAVFISNGCGSCHTFAAAGTTGTVGPDLNEYLAPDDNAEGIEEMIVDPEAEIAEGYSGGIMPTNFGETIPKEELQELVQFLVNNSRAGGEEEEGAGGEEEDVGGPTN